MDIKKLLQEIENLESNMKDIGNLLGAHGLHGFNLIVAAANHTQWRGAADQELLIEALKSKGNKMHEGLVKLIDVAGVVEKVIDRLVAQAAFLLAHDTNRG